MSTPIQANERKSAVESILLQVKKFDPDLIYSIDNDEVDLKVKIRFYSETGYVPFRAVPIEYIDRHGTVPEIPTIAQDPEEEVRFDATKPDANSVDESNPENWRRILASKRKAVSPAKRPGKYARVPPKELGEYLRDFVNGVAGRPDFTRDE